MFYTIVHAEIPSLMANMYAKEFFRTHSFLRLVASDSKGRLSRAFTDEIHFTTDGVMRDGTFYYSQYFQATARALEYGLYYQHISARKDVMKEEWETAKGIAKTIASNPEFKFDSSRNPESDDCRAGTIAILKNLGLEYYAPKRCKDISGRQSNLWQRLEK